MDWESYSRVWSTGSFSGDSKYLPPLQVYRREDSREELYQEFTSGLESGAAYIGPYPQEIKDKMESVLNHLRFREPRVLVQFWSPHEAGTLTTRGLPFGLGVIDERLQSYMRESEGDIVLVEDHEKDLSPPARVFIRGLPEWTLDVTNYLPEQFPQQESAIHCNLHGYLALPVFDLTADKCVGVLEVLMSSKYIDYAYEVQKIQDALETQNLTSLHGSVCSALNVPNEHKQNDLDEIYSILKRVCDIHCLPLAQAWAVSQHTSFVSHEKVIEKRCGSFDNRCVGKVCMSTAALPFYVKDLDMWSFREACRERHLDSSRGLVGRALSIRASCFCEDVTQLSEEVYPLVHNARMNRLTGCFGIFLYGVETYGEYVLEFFLPPDIKDSGHVLNLVHTLKQIIEVAPQFELGDTSSVEDVSPPMDLSVDMEPDVIQTSSDSMADNFKFLASSSNSESFYSPVPEMVTAEITFNDTMKIFRFPISLGLSNLENEVAESFHLKGKRLCLKYRDKDDDLILIACNVDLKFAVDTTGSNIINLICLSD